MPFQIEDGAGSGYKVQVNNENRLETDAVSEKISFHANKHHGSAYSVIISKTPAAGGNKCFLYIKNTSDLDMVVKSIKIRTASDERIQIKLNDIGTLAGGTTNTPANRNAASGNIADCICQDGTDITGLSGGTIVDDIYFDVDLGMQKINWDSGIIVPKNQIITFYAVTSNIAILMTITIYFHV